TGRLREATGRGSLSTESLGGRLGVEEVRRRGRAVALAVGLMTAAFVLAKTGRDALFFMGSGLRDLPKAYMVIAILALPMATAALGLMRILGPRRARIVAPLLM